MARDVQNLVLELLSVESCYILRAKVSSNDDIGPRSALNIIFALWKFDDRVEAVDTHGISDMTEVKAQLDVYELDVGG